MPFPERVQVVKQESTTLGGSDADSGPDVADPINPFEDVIEAAGYEVQEPDGSTRDSAVMISRSSGKMTFKDTENTSPLTLTELATAGTPDFSKCILTVAGTLVYAGDGNIVLKV